MRKRTLGINIRVNEAEKQRLKSLAGFCKLSISDYLRTLGLNPEISPVTKAEIRQIYSSLKEVKDSLCHSTLIETEHNIEEIITMISKII